jgi:hypothetical protein
MKRGKPLKRTPLKRGNSSLKRTPLKSKSSLKSNTPLKNRSDKTKEVYKTRRVLVKEILESRPECEACMPFSVFDRLDMKTRSWSDKPSNALGVIRTKRSQDVHELVNRSQGGDILDLPNLLAVCRPCHTRITENPDDSELLGLHVPSWCYNKEYLDDARRVRESWGSGIPAVPRWIDDYF